MTLLYMYPILLYEDVQLKKEPQALQPEFIGEYSLLKPVALN